MKPRESISEHLLRTKAIYANIKTPFVFTSGLKSPVYVDCRKIISFPEVIRDVVDTAVEIVGKKIGAENVDVVAGGETAGIPYAAFLSYALRLPMIYVRKKPKGFGAGKQIEGVLEKGQKVLLFEDLITDGGSKLNFLNGVVDAGCEMPNCLVVFEYGKKGCRELLKENGVELYSMTDWETTLKVALDKKYFSKEEHEEVKSFLADPDNWAKNRGLD